jgi:crotonobetainyl-CoA:carnitine CoA-transferase CaiB-like acyl-CoA transferase
VDLDRPGHQEGTAQVHRDDRVPVGLGHLEQQIVPGDSGVVHEHRRCAKLSGHPADGRSDLVGVTRSAELDAALAPWFLARDRDKAVAELQAAGVAAVPVLTEAEARTRALATTEVVEHPLVGAAELTPLPWAFSATPVRIGRSAPLIGQHSAEVLGEVLGISGEDLAALLARPATR